MTPTTIIPENDEAVQALALELGALRVQMKHIKSRIAVLQRLVPRGMDRPDWGPCTRCGHRWKGHWINLPPRGCPRCGSTGWRLEPKSLNARRPEDPPNPRWGKNRQTGLPTKPSLPEARLPSREERAAQPPPRRGLTPPPKLGEVLAKPTLVPARSIRFAEGGTSSVAERDGAIVEAAGSIPVSRSNEPDDGVPIRIESDGTITELLEAVESDGTVWPEEE